MHKTKPFAFIASLLVMNSALAIQPVSEGEEY
jgi:hypothetical protein